MGLLSSLQPGLFAGAGALAQGFETGAFAGAAGMLNLGLLRTGMTASGMADSPLSAMIGTYEKAASADNSDVKEELGRTIAGHIREDHEALNRVLAHIPQGLFGGARFGAPPAAGDTDITTDADFPAMGHAGRSLGMPQTFFGSQRRFFEELAHSMEKNFLAAAEGYKVQIFEKKTGTTLVSHSVSPEYRDLMAGPYVDLLKGVMSFQGLATRLDPEFTFAQDGR